MFGGSYTHQLDAKNRMRIPAKLREQLGSNYTIMVGSGGCLYVYSEEQAAKMRKKLSSINPFKESQLKAARYILHNSWDAEEDKQGRILIPERIRKIAKIVKNVVVSSGPNCIEIWAEEVWNDYYKEIEFESLADAFDKLDDGQA